MNKIIKLVTDYSVPSYVEDWRSSTDFDTRIICPDGECFAHRLVLCHVSPYIGESLDDQFPGEETVIIIPDTPVTVMDKMLELAYTGSMIVSPEVLVTIEDYMKYLGWVCLATCDKTEYSQPMESSTCVPGVSPINTESLIVVPLDESDDNRPPLQNNPQNMSVQKDEFRNEPLPQDESENMPSSNSESRNERQVSTKHVFHPVQPLEEASVTDYSSSTVYPSSNYTDGFMVLGFSESYSQVLSPSNFQLVESIAKHPQHDAIFYENQVKRNCPEGVENNSGEITEYSANSEVYPTAEEHGSLPVDTDEEATSAEAQSTSRNVASAISSDYIPAAQTTKKKNSLGLSRGVPPKRFDSSQEFSPGPSGPSPSPCNPSSQDDFKTSRRTRSSVLSKLIENAAAVTETVPATPKRHKLTSESDLSVALGKAVSRQTRQTYTSTMNETSPGARRTRTSSRKKSNPFDEA